MEEFVSFEVRVCVLCVSGPEKKHAGVGRRQHSKQEHINLPILISLAPSAVSPAYSQPYHQLCRRRKGPPAAKKEDDDHFSGCERQQRRRRRNLLAEGTDSGEGDRK